ncbi:hypothetical protein JB92DRAFT_3138283 [Gautieria morchelliformis]|nr:hypothetical protein JB92DRAFT_3138283 [Gautieria morchelliformis]
MEMYLFDRLAIGLERLYTAVPSILLNLYEVTWEASSLSCILSQELYKCVLLTLNIIRAILRLLAYFFHFDPPTFNTLREMAHIYLDPDAASNQRERLFIEHTIARLEADNVVLLKKNEELSSRVDFLQSHVRGMEFSLAERKDMAHQLLLGILACRQSVRSFAPWSQSPKLQLGVSPRLLASRHIYKADTDETQAQDTVTPQLLVHLLMFRRSTKCTADAVTTMTSANGQLKKAVRCCEDTLQSLLIELLTIRKHARALCAQNRMKNRLVIILARKQQLEKQARDAEHETATQHILVQTLTLRRRLSDLILSIKSASLVPASPKLPVTQLHPASSYQSLAAQLDALRLSEAQARAEKDSLAKSLSDVLADLPLPDLCVTVEEEPVRELVLALAFTWKMLPRKPLANLKLDVVHTEMADGQASLEPIGEMKTLRPSILSDSVRARAFRLKPAIPIQDILVHGNSPVYDFIHDAHAAINLDPPQGRGTIQVMDSRAQFPPNMPLPLRRVRSPVLRPHHQQVLRPLLPSPIHPPRSTAMSRGGYIFETPNEVIFALTDRFATSLPLVTGVLRDRS